MPLRFLKLLISLLVAFLDWLYAVIGRLLGGQPKTICTVIYYHSVPAAARGKFASQMDELARLSVPISFEGRKPETEGRRYSAVTFDDAFMSVVENALPELRARQIPCTIFVPTGSMGGHPSWIGPYHDDAGEVVVSTDVLHKISASPLVQVGSHSITHPDFRRIDDEQARAEFTSSKATLEEVVDREVTSFSFPHGAYSQRSLDLARQSGYERVFTIEPLPLNDPSGEFVVGRVRVDPYDWPIEFHLKAIGAYRWMAHASALKRKLLGIVRGGRVQLPQPEKGL